MNRARDEFLARPGLAVNQHRGIGGRNGFDLGEHAAQGVAVADDFVEVQFGADFVFEIQFLLRELIPKFGYLAVGKRILDCDRYLLRDLCEESDFLVRKRAFRPCFPR